MKNSKSRSKQQKRSPVKISHKRPKTSDEDSPHKGLKTETATSATNAKPSMAGMAPITQRAAFSPMHQQEVVDLDDGHVADRRFSSVKLNS